LKLPAPARLPHADTPAIGSAEERELIREAIRDAERGALVYPFMLRESH
jgi:hypothetical protein